MISLNKNSIRTFNRVSDPVLDWIYLSGRDSNKEQPQMTYEYKILQNTSGSPYGGRDKVEKAIEDAKRKYPILAQYDTSEIYLKIVDNISKDRSKFNPNKGIPLEKFAVMRVKNALKSINSELNKKGIRTVRFESESDSDGDGDDFTPTTEFQLYKMGKLAEIEVELDPIEARELFIDSLRSLSIFEKNTLSSSQTQVSSILLMQAKIAIQELDAGDIQNINVSLGLDKTQNIKNSIAKKLEADRLGPKIYHNAVVNLYRACQALHIPIFEIPKEATSDRFIRSLTLALEHGKTVCVTEYDYPLLPNFLPKEEVNYRLLTKALGEKEYVRSITNSILEELNKIKISQLRNIETVANKVRAYYDEWNSDAPRVDTNGKTDFQIKEELLNNTPLMNIGRKTAYKTVVESEEYGGPLCPTALKIISNKVANYLVDMEVKDPERYDNLMSTIDDLLDNTPNIGVANNGFLIEKNTGNYFHASINNSVFFINVSGYMIKNYIHFNFYRDDIKGLTTVKGNIGEKGERFVYRESGDPKDFSVLEVYDPTDMSLIFKGNTDSWREAH